MPEHAVGARDQAGAARRMTGKRQYALALLAGAIGGGLILLSVRQRWAQAVFTPPKPLSPQVINVSGTDLVPLAGALGIAALACLAAVIATRGVARRIAGVLLAAFGLGTAVAVAAAVSAATVLSVAAGKAGSPGSAAVTGTAGSTTGGAAGGGGAFTIVGSNGHAVMTGTPWQVAVLLGALLVVAAGAATAWRGPRWPVMSARYDLPERNVTQSPASGTPGTPGAEAGAPARARDSASMWESLSAGADPTDAP